MHNREGLLQRDIGTRTMMLAMSILNTKAIPTLYHHNFARCPVIEIVWANSRRPIRIKNVGMTCEIAKIEKISPNIPSSSTSVMIMGEVKPKIIIPKEWRLVGHHR